MSCTLIGKKKNKVRCTTTSTASKAGSRIRVRISRNGRLVSTAASRVVRGAASVTLNAKAGRYTVVASVPDRVGRYHRVSQQIVLK